MLIQLLLNQLNHHHDLIPLIRLTNVDAKIRSIMDLFHKKFIETNSSRERVKDPFDRGQFFRTESILLMVSGILKNKKMPFGTLFRIDFYGISGRLR